MRRLVVDALAPGPYTLIGSPAHYLIHVLRLKSGAEIELSDGQGHMALACVKTIERQQVGVIIEAIHPQDTSIPALTVALPMPQTSRADWVVEKLTEIGVHSIVWLVTERTQPRARLTSRFARLERLAKKAAAQCGMFHVPTSSEPKPLAEFLRESFAIKFFATQYGQSLFSCLPAATPKSAALVIGPEGGFSKTEEHDILAAGYHSICLGPATLRIETAAVVGAGVLLAAWFKQRTSP